MSEVVKEFERFILDQQLFTQEELLIVAISGGVDSTVLVHLLNRLGYRFALAHCNFQLRGEASDGDEAFVKALGEHYNVRVHCMRFDTKQEAKDLKISTQLAARQLRYGWFDKLKISLKTDKLLTAHHIDDSIETSIYNFIKGGGVKGIKGISAKNEMAIRPMLCLTRTQVMEYALANGIKWREDASNKETKYKRNLIRHKLVPLIKEINPGLGSTLQRNQKRFQGTDEVLTMVAADITQKYLEDTDGRWQLMKSGLEQYVDTARAVLLDIILTQYGFNYEQLLDCCRAWKEVGKRFISSTHQLIIDREYLMITPLQDDREESIYTFQEEGKYGCGQYQYTIHSKDYLPGKFSNESWVATLDANKVIFPLRLRPWKQGDRFVPLGMRNKKKLSDFMIDLKIPLNLKSEVMVLESAQGEILWVVGYRIDDRFKLSSDTKRALHINVKKT